MATARETDAMRNTGEYLSERRRLESAAKVPAAEPGDSAAKRQAAKDERFVRRNKS